MARFISTITNKGEEVLTAFLATGKQLVLTNASVGNGVAHESQNTLTELVNPINVDTHLGEKTFIEGNPSYMKIPVQVTNAGLESPEYIREVAIYALDENDVPFMFIYSWLDGGDSDNILPACSFPEASTVTGKGDTIHIHDVAVIVTNQENSSVKVNVSPGSFVTMSQLETYQDQTWRLQGGTGIPDSADLNTYTTPGNYYCRLSVTAQTLLNCPVSRAFTLKVEFGTGITRSTQVLREYNTGIVYWRYDTVDSTTGSSTAPEWSDWKQYAFVDDITLAKLGLTATEAELNKLDGATITTQELNYLDGVTSPIQSQLDQLEAAAQEPVWLLKGGSQIPEDADLDTYITPGNYYCNLNAVVETLANCPVRVAFTMKVEYGTGTSYSVQTLREYNTGKLFWRYRNGSATPMVWTDWKQYAFAEDTYQLQGGTAIQANDDLNDYTNPGNYYSSGYSISNTLSHCPVSAAFTMRVENGNGISYPAQILRQYNTGVTYWRFQNLMEEGDPWSDWKQYAFAGDTYALQGGIEIPENADLNDYLTPGNYYCRTNPAAAKIGNSPTQKAFTMKIEMGNGNYYQCQTIREYDTGIMYRRVNNTTSSTTTNWSVWKQYAFVGDITLSNLGVTATAAELNVLDGDPNTVTNNLAALSLAPTQQISDGDDLNDYLTPGSYLAKDAANAAAIVNTPTTTSGYSLHVLKTYGLTSNLLYRTQIVITYSGKIFLRYRNNVGTFSAWKEWKLDGTTLSDLGITATAAELNYVDGVTSSIQTQLNGKAASSHTHGASSITAGTFGATGVKAATGTDYTTARVRNIQASTTDLTAGSSALANGTIYLVYE